MCHPPNIEAAPVAGGNGKKSYTFLSTSLDPPCDGSLGLAINDSNVFVGSCGLAGGGGAAFLYNGSGYMLFSYPDAWDTEARGVDNVGRIVGRYSPTPPVENYSFLNDNGAFSTIVFPGAVRPAALGINDAGTVVGYYTTDGGQTYNGFTQTVNSSSFTTLNHPRGVSTFLRGINGQGQIVGSYKDSRGDYHGFLYYNGQFTAIDYPRAVSTGMHGMGINNNGEIVGDYTLTGAILSGSGFFYNGNGFTDVSFNWPGSVYSDAYGINDGAWIIGAYGDLSVLRGSFLAIVP